MKKVVPVLSWVLYALLLLMPVGTIAAACFGYTFEITRPALFAVVIALTAVALVALCVVGKVTVERGALPILFALATPVSLICAAFYLFRYDVMVWVAMSMVVCIGCCIYLAVQYGKPLSLKIAALVLSALMALLIGFFGFIMVVFAGFGLNTVVRTVESPSGMYYAEVIDSDQGALGGDTLVKVHQNREFRVLIFKVVKTPQTVYIGEWGTADMMEIYWKDDSCLVIYSTEYFIE